MDSTILSRWPVHRASGFQTASNKVAGRRIDWCAKNLQAVLGKLVFSNRSVCSTAADTAFTGVQEEQRFQHKWPHCIIESSRAASEAGKTAARHYGDSQ